MQSWSRQDQKAFSLLILIYFLQGIPLGLVLGSLPVLLRPLITFRDLSTLGISSYPYSLKLLWSPIVDSCYSAKFGRRKTWIIPLQFAIAVLLALLATQLEDWLNPSNPKFGNLVISLIFLVILCATQDVATDGLALQILSKQKVTWSSTCQTIGLTSGFFLSNAGVLALTALEPDTRLLGLNLPKVSLTSYLYFVSILFVVADIFIFFILKEDEHVSYKSKQELGVCDTYKAIFQLFRKSYFRDLCFLHIFGKLCFVAIESGLAFALFEKGLEPNDFAMVSLINFPVELFAATIVGVYLAKRSTSEKVQETSHQLRPWRSAYCLRLFANVTLLFYIYLLPSGSNRHRSLTLVYAFLYVLLRISSSVQFVTLSAFHSQVADPGVGGTYLAVLNTISNLSETFPRLIYLRIIDWASSYYCVLPNGSKSNIVDRGGVLDSTQECTKYSGSIHSYLEGFFGVGLITILGAIYLYPAFIIPQSRRIAKIPASFWKVV